MQRKIVIAGSMVSLVEMTEADQTFFQEWLQRPELRELIDDPRIPTLEDQMKWFKRVQEPDRKFFSLVTKDGMLIGNCGFVHIDAAKKEATLRITIGHPEAVGKGYGSEAVQLLVRYAFETAKWKKLHLKVLKDNARAIRSYEKSGFTIDGEHLQNGKSILTMTLSA
jgi:RimJ/RimL family protein N-acetyltransferase